MSIKRKEIIVVSPSPSDNIILTGFMGCGKSYFSSRLAASLNFTLEDTDTMIENEAKISIKEIFSTFGESYFRTLEAQAAEKIKTFHKSVVATGGGFPIYYKDIKALGTVIYMDISFDAILSRMNEEDILKRPLFSDLKAARELFNEREKIYKERSHFQLDATLSVEKMIEISKDFLA